MNAIAEPDNREPPSFAGRARAISARAGSQLAAWIATLNAALREAELGAGREDGERIFHLTAHEPPRRRRAAPTASKDGGGER